MNTELHFSSKTDEWATPQDFFDKLNETYKFNLDPCANNKNHKCKFYFTRNDNWLSMDWRIYDFHLWLIWNNQYYPSRVFCNPPYWRALKDWVKKASEEIKKDYCDLIVMLIPARTDTKYFHEYIYRKENIEIEFIKWRLKFWDSKNAAPFPSMLIIFNKNNYAY